MINLKSNDINLHHLKPNTTRLKLIFSILFPVLFYLIFPLLTSIPFVTLVSHPSFLIPFPYIDSVSAITCLKIAIDCHAPI